MSKGYLFETEYGRNSRPDLQPGFPEMVLIDVLYGRYMRDPIIGCDNPLTTVDELAARCRTTERGVIDLINQGQIIIRTPFGIQLKPVKVTNNQVGVSSLNGAQPKELSKPTPVSKNTRSLPKSVKSFMGTMESLACFPTQNPQTVEQNLLAAYQQDRPFTSNCFVCLVNEWRLVDGKPVYRVCLDPSQLSRLEQPQFVERSREIFKKLDQTGVPYEWTFSIADTDAYEIFNDWADSEQNRPADIEKFRQRVASKLTLNNSVKTRLWSEIQRPFDSQYQANFTGVLKRDIPIPNLEQILKERFDYYCDFYRRYFTSRGMKIDERWIRELATIPPERNVALYSGQGPIQRDSFDFLIIGDRDATRCGRNQSFLAPDMGIYYPYPGG